MRFRQFVFAVARPYICVTHRQTVRHFVKIVKSCSWHSQNVYIRQKPEVEYFYDFNTFVLYKIYKKVKKETFFNLKHLIEKCLSDLPRENTLLAIKVLACIEKYEVMNVSKCFDEYILRNRIKGTGMNLGPDVFLILLITYKFRTELSPVWFDLKFFFLVLDRKEKILLLIPQM